MKTLGMKNLEKFLSKIVKHKLHNSLMIWGAPGLVNHLLFNQSLVRIN